MSAIVCFIMTGEHPGTGIGIPDIAGVYSLVDEEAFGFESRYFYLENAEVYLEIITQ